MRTELPTGVVTLLFTDIEGSTRLLGELRGAYVDALAEHRRIIRDAAAAHGGIEVDTQGDSFLIAFTRPSGAVAAAIAAQRQLADGPISVRMGIHTGEPKLTDEGYIGLDVHRGARIGDSGHGGQILLSSATHALVDLDSVDLGEHRLRGIERPERLYGLVVDGLRTDFPPLRAIDTSDPDLPTWLTGFIGREAELALLEERLTDRETHIVTLVGPGGAGKTRLAAEAARRRWSATGVSTAFASAIGADDADGLLLAICEGLGFAVDAAHGFGRTLREQVGDYLAQQPRLLLVDNVEHVADAGAVLSELAQAAPSARLLVTSRRRLGLAGEWVIEVGGLRRATTGDGDANPTDPAIRLFLDRARRATTDLSVTDDDWPHIGRICELLDDMPLGIELAAAWMGVLSAEELAQEVASSFDLLESAAADLAPRHRSLRAAFEGSWRLLDERERAALAGMSVFVGSFDRRIATATTGADTAALAELVARSLVRRRPDGRYEIHELLRQYAALELARSEQEATIREAHARAFRERLLDQVAALESPASLEARSRLTPDYGNLRVALEWAVARWSLDEVRGLLLPASTLWTMGVDPIAVEMWGAIARAAAGRDGSTDQATDAATIGHLVAPHLAFALAVVDDNEAADAAAEGSLPALEAADFETEAAMCRMVLGIDRCNRNENEAAIEPLEAADAGLRAPEHRLLRGELLTWLGWARLMLDDAAGAREAFDLAYELCDGLGEPLSTAFALSKLALLEDLAGEYEAALDRHLAAFARFDEAGNQGGVGYALSRASFTAYCLGRYQAALDFGQAAYEGFSEINHHWGVILATARLGFACLGLERLSEAERWGLHSLELVRGDDRGGKLHSLGPVAGAMARRGDVEGLRVLRAIVADDDMPRFLAMQIQAEVEVAERRFGDVEPGEPIDLDAMMTRLLERAHPAPVPH